MSAETAAENPSGTVQPPLVFSESESIPLGFTNKLLRKAAYGFGILSFICTGLSGVSEQNHWRTASGFGSVGINVATLLMKERDDPLPDTSIPAQMGHSFLKPWENTLFFNRASTFITDVLKFAAGLKSARPKEIREGIWKIGTKAVDIAGISDQDRREKLALEVPGENAKKVSPLRKIFANRWISLLSSAYAAKLQIGQGIDHGDRNMLASGIFYLIAVSSLAADNAIMEFRIKTANAGKAR